MLTIKEVIARLQKVDDYQFPPTHIQDHEPGQLYVGQFSVGELPVEEVLGQEDTPGFYWIFESEDQPLSEAELNDVVQWMMGVFDTKEEAIANFEDGRE